MGQYNLISKYGRWSLLLIGLVPNLALAATLSLSPSTSTVNVGDKLNVAIILNTDSQTISGVDAKLRFDKAVFAVEDSSSSQTGVQIQAGTLLSTVAFNSVSNSDGTISFSAAKTGGSSGYTGTGTLATITLRALTASTGSPVTFDFTSGSTTDSNISTGTSDVLTAVTNGNYVVNTAGTSSTTTSSSSTSTTTSTTSSPTAGSTTTTSTDTSGSGTVSSDGSAATTDANGDGVVDAADLAGAAGQAGTDGQGGSEEVANTGLNLTTSLWLTIIALVAGIWLLKPQARKGR
ncbi:MAG: hypothetical protein CEO22_39 [Candidatus Berkelbacteria bacterium Gr01-1014_85]|uniref:Uncharacterized protein n=1 Tax=Candidatus Berkelbacteria bacterium Gr01-1014_85 TaxID=2017150 RepID=A0A554JE24_9BACT|nr:MAG: hypothetical protein CEO22_39 [Candidatus Berkelbacteria bacterium Gr01-1014_85]